MRLAFVHNHSQVLSALCIEIEVSEASESKPWADMHSRIITVRARVY